MSSCSFASAGKVLLKCNPLYRSEFWSYLRCCRLQEEGGHFQDLAIECGDDRRRVSCHRLVLSAASEMFYTALTDRWKQDELDVGEVVVLPDYKFADVTEAIDNLYAFLGGVIDVETFLAPALTNPFYALLSENGIVRRRPKKRKNDVEEVCDDNKVEEESKEAMSMNFLHPESVLKSLAEESFEEPPIYDEFGDDFEVDDKGFEPKKKLQLLNEKADPSSPSTKKRRKHQGMKTRRRKSNWQPKTLDELLEGDDPREEDLPCAVNRKALYDLMTASNTTLTVKMLREPLDVQVHCSKSHRIGSAFQVLMGLRALHPSSSLSNSEEAFDARPIAWSLPTSIDVTNQFNRAYDAFASTFGFSEVDICYNGLLLSRQGHFKKNKSKKVRYALKRIYAHFTNEQLRELISKDSIVHVTRRRPPKSRLIASESEKCKLRMRQDLEMHLLDGIALVSWDKETGEVTGRMVFSDENDPDESSNQILKCLFDVWCIARPLRIPENEYLSRKYSDLMEPMETYILVQEYLHDDPSGEKRKNLLSKEKQCSECGKIFPCVTVTDESRLINHKRSHYYENFICECTDIPPFKSLAEKRVHVQLVHSNGKFKKCRHCTFVATLPAVDRHEEQDHRDSRPKPDGRGRTYSVPVPSCMCETCGKVLNNTRALASHMLIHKVYQCKLCTAQIVGLSAFDTHKRNAHPEEHPRKETGVYSCEVCSRLFQSKTSLSKHHLRAHVDEKDQPFQCEDCGRGFPFKSLLMSHRMMAHIKARPYKCRYGCGADYNDTASRGTHERKKHGAPVEDRYRRRKKLSTNFLEEANS